MAEKVREKPYLIVPWIGEFADPGMENRYRDHVATDTARELRIALAVWAGLILLFALNDYVLLGEAGGAFYEALAGRMATTVWLVAFIIALRRKPHLATQGTVLTIIIVVSFAIFFRFYFILPRESIIWLVVVTIIMLLAIFIFLPNRAILSLLAATWGVAGTAASVYLATATSATRMAGLTLTLALPTVIGYAAAYRYQVARRRQFASLDRAETINYELQREIGRRKELEKELQRQANTDALTGAYNRRYYETAFNREMKRTRRHGCPLALCLLDLDHFKSVNDDHGHAAGDAALRMVAHVCRAELRESDILGRLGGEEFIVILPHTGTAGAFEVAERLRKRLAETDVDEEGKTFRITATFGVAELRDDDTSLEDIIRRADKALYHGKSKGRNCVYSS